MKIQNLLASTAMLLVCLAFSSSVSAQIVGNQGSDPIDFKSTLGDKISLYGDRINLYNNYGIGVASNTMYFKSNGKYTWLKQENYSSNDISVAMTLTSAGRLGLGYRDPAASLHIYYGTDAVVDNTQSGYIVVGNHLGTNIVIDNNEIMARNFNSIPNSSTLFLNADGGTVNINTKASNSNYSLMVGGAIRAEEIKVETGWADFVFEDDYQLRSLEEVESYINENGHLPEIPSAEVVEAEGVNLGEMESKLLMKIEELTLYMIDMNKTMQELKAENAALKAQIEQR